MNIPQDLHYTKDHEWLRVDGDEGVIGITEYAQGELGDIVYVEMPEPGDEVLLGKAFGSIEAVKAASDLYAPVTGEVTAVNGVLEQNPELINQDPYGVGWIIKIRLTDPAEADTLLKPDDYARLVESNK